MPSVPFWLYLAAIVASVALVYCACRGKNWARIIILLVVVMNLLNDVMLLQWLSRFSPVRKSIIGLRFISAVAVIVWLNIRKYRQQ